MDDNESQLIRCQMDSTRSDLSEKLEAIEERVTEGVQSTGSAVNATVTTIRDTVASVGEALDLRLQVQRHPWIVFGGSVALGYLAARLSESPRIVPEMPVPVFQVTPLQPPTVTADERLGRPATDHRDGQKGVIYAALVGVLIDLTVRSLPVVLDYFIGQRGNRPPLKSSLTPTTETVPLSSMRTLDASRRLTRHVM